MLGPGGAAGSPGETRWDLGPSLPWIQPVPQAEQTVWAWGGRGTKGAVASREDLRQLSVTCHI